MASLYSTRRSALKDSDEDFAENLAFAGRLLGLNGAEPLLFCPPGGAARSSQLALARRQG